MSKQRLEAFTDGVIAIIITLMVLSIPLPSSFESKELWGFLNSILIYLISFVVVGAFWNQHHRIFTYIEKINHKIVGANFLFLFFLSLIPLFTKWVIDNKDSILPVIIYDITYLLVSFCYIFIFRLIMENTEHSQFIQIMQKMEIIKQRKIRKKIFVIPLLIPTILLCIIIVLSIFIPKLSIFIFLGIPILASSVNLFVEDKVSRMLKKQKR